MGWQMSSGKVPGPLALFAVGYERRTRLWRRRLSGGARRGAAPRRRGAQGRSRGKYRQIPNSRLSAFTPKGLSI
jgi:hypothetical protein